MKRSFDRRVDQFRPVQIIPDVNRYAEGSVIIEFGHTRVLCTASVDERVPPFQKEKEEGWVTAEYNMLPRSTHTRTERERKKLGGRTMEIQRLIGRSLRAVVDLKKLAGFSLTVDCDVLQADGGTRTASITGAYVALAIALKRLVREGKLTSNPLTSPVAAISLGLLNNEVLLDLDYEEDFACEVDLNLVMSGDGKIVEVQGTAEEHPFSREELDKMLVIGEKAIKELCSLQQAVLNR